MLEWRRMKLKTLTKEVFGEALGRNFSIHAINNLESAIKKGMRFTLENHARAVFKPKNEDELWTAKFIVKRWVSALKRRFAKGDIWFGSVNKKHEYGFIETQEEFDYVDRRELKRQKGWTKKTLQLEENLKRFKRFKKMS